MLKVVFGFVLILVLMGTCIAVMANTTNDSKVSPSPTRRPIVATSTPRSIPTATATPWTNKYQATNPPTQQVRPTPTAINETEHKLWLDWPDHYDDLEKLLREMETNSNSIMADGILDSNDLISLCPEISGWEQRLNPIAKFMAEYRATDPKTIEENTPLQNMEEAVGVALDHVNNSKALCN